MATMAEVMLYRYREVFLHTCALQNLGRPGGSFFKLCVHSHNKYLFYFTHSNLAYPQNSSKRPQSFMNVKPRGKNIIK